MKKLVTIAVLTLSSLCVLSAKTYDLSLPNVTRAGNIQLKPGQYTLKVQGNNAVFTDINSDQSFTTPVKVEAVDKKFTDTEVQSTRNGDADKIEEIDLGGSKTKLGF